MYSFPYIIRFKQCVIETINTHIKHDKILNSLNAVKYFLLLGSMLLLPYFENMKLSVIGISLAATSICLAAYWDLFMDWGLGKKHVRQNLGYTSFFVSILNVCIRLISISKFSNSLYLNVFLVNGLEILRRCLWVHLRLLNHQLRHESV